MRYAYDLYSIRITSAFEIQAVGTVLPNLFWFRLDLELPYEIICYFPNKKFIYCQGRNKKLSSIPSAFYWAVLTVNLRLLIIPTHSSHRSITLGTYIELYKVIHRFIYTGKWLWLTVIVSRDPSMINLFNFFSPYGRLNEKTDISR